MADFFLSDDSDGAACSSNPQVESYYAMHSQVTVDRRFSIRQMSHATTPPAETTNRGNAVVRAESEGNMATGGPPSPPSGNDVSGVHLHLSPLTTEPQANRVTEEQTDGMDASTSTEPEPSEEKSGEFQAVSESEANIQTQPPGQKSTVLRPSPTEEPTSLRKAPEKVGKGEEGAPALSLAAEKEPVAEGPEPEFPHSMPEKEKAATPSPGEMEPPLPQPPPPPSPESEQKVPQVPPEMEPSIPQAPPDEEQKVPPMEVGKGEEGAPALPLAAEKEPVAEGPEPEFPHSMPEKEKAATLSPGEMEPPLPQPPPPPPSPESEQKIPQVPPEMEPSVPQAPPDEEQKVPPMESVGVRERIALRGISPHRFERTAAQQEKETAGRSERKTWPGKEDTSSSARAYLKPKPAAGTHEEKDAFLNNTVEDLTAHLRQVSSASKSAMANSISSFVGSSIGQLFAHTIDRALDKSEEWLEYYLPGSDTDVEASVAAQEEYSDASEDHSKEGCFMRINTLSTKLRDRAFRLALHQLKTTRQAAKVNLPVLDQILDMLEHSRGQHLLSISSIPESLQNLWAQWGPKQELLRTKSSGMSSREPPSIVPEQLELKALDLTRSLAQQLYGTYHDLLPHVTDLPAHLQEKVIRVYESMEDLHSHFATSPALHDLPSNLILQSRQRMLRAQENLDEILDFMAQNPAAKWLSQSTSFTKGKQPASDAVERRQKGRSPEQRAREESPSAKRPQSPPHHL